MTSRRPARAHLVARLGAPLLFLGCAALEVVSLASGQSWRGFLPDFRLGLGVLDAALWLASAAILALGTTKALYVPVYGALMLLSEAVVARAAGSPRELVYLAVLPLVVAFESIDIKHVLGIDRADAEPSPFVPATA
jgi:hypothetical protein